MKLSGEQQTALRTQLESSNVNIGGGVFDLVEQVIPERVRDMEGTMQIDACAALKEGRELDVPDAAEDGQKISNGDYKILWQTITAIKDMAGGKPLVQGKEMLFERRMMAAQETLSRVMMGLSEEIHNQCPGLKTQNITRAAKKVVSNWSSRGEEVGGEQQLELEEAGFRGTHHLMLQSQINQLQACCEMVDVFNRMLVLIKEDRSRKLEEQQSQ